MAGRAKETKRADKTIVDVKMKKKSKKKEEEKGNERRTGDGAGEREQCGECEKEMLVLTHARSRETKIEVITTVINKELEQLKKQLSNDPDQSPTKLKIRLFNEADKSTGDGEKDVEETLANRTEISKDGDPCRKGCQPGNQGGDSHTIEFDYNVDEYQCNECNGNFCNHKMEAYLNKFCFPNQHILNRVKRLHSLCLVSNLFCWTCGNVFASKEALMLHGIRHTKEMDTLRTRSETEAKQESKCIPAMSVSDLNESAKEAIRKSLQGMQKSVKEAKAFLDIADKLAEGPEIPNVQKEQEQEEHEKDEQDKEEDDDDVFQDITPLDLCSHLSFPKFCKHRQKNYLEKFCFPDDQEVRESESEEKSDQSRRQRSESVSDPTWFCDECGSLFVGDEAITMHEELHEKSKLEAVLHALSSSGYRCVVCGDGFQTELKLRAHTKKRHRKLSSC